MDFFNTLTDNPVILFALWTGTAALAALLFKWILNTGVHRLTARTETDLDDRVLHIASGPFQMIVFMVLFYQALIIVQIPSPYDRWIDRSYIVVIAMVAATVVSRSAVLLISHWLAVEKQYERSPKLVGKIISVTIYILAALMLLNHFQINITPLITALGIGGLAVGLALQGTLSNFFAGLHIITDRPFVVGDYIQVQEWNVEGYIEDIGWRTTRIRTLPNTIVVVPNNKIAESVVTNNYMPEQQMSAVVQCGVAYESDLEKVERVTIEVAKEIQQSQEGAVTDFEPFIRYHTFADSNINFSIILRVIRYEDRFPVIHAFMKALKTRYDREKIEIAWPIRKVYQAGADGSLKN